MSLPIKKYLDSAILSQRQDRVFQFEFFMSLCLILLQTLIYWLVFSNILTPNVLTAKELVQYYVLIDLVTLSLFPAQLVAYEHQEAINSGRVILELAKPLSPTWNWFGCKLYSFLFRLAIYLLLLIPVQWIFFGTPQLIYLVRGIVATILGFVILYLLQGIIGACSVWLRDVLRMRDFLIYDLSMILGGQLFPSSHLAANLKTIVYFTPFPYIYDVPTTCFQGHWRPTYMLAQIIWVLFLGIIYLMLMKKVVLKNIEYGA